MTPEGHRAPLADLLRATRSVNTQTPATDLPSSSYSSGECSEGLSNISETVRSTNIHTLRSIFYIRNNNSMCSLKRRTSVEEF